MFVRKSISTLALGAALGVGVALSAAPASAQIHLNHLTLNGADLTGIPRSDADGKAIVPGWASGAREANQISLNDLSLNGDAASDTTERTPVDVNQLRLQGITLGGGSASTLLLR